MEKFRDSVKIVWKSLSNSINKFWKRLSIEDAEETQEYKWTGDLAWGMETQNGLAKRQESLNSNWGESKPNQEKNLRESLDINEENTKNNIDLPNKDDNDIVL